VNYSTSVDEAKAVAAAIRVLGGRAFACHAMLGLRGRQGDGGGVVKEFGRLDILVTMRGWHWRKRFIDTGPVD